MKVVHTQLGDVRVHRKQKPMEMQTTEGHSAENADSYAMLLTSCKTDNTTASSSKLNTVAAMDNSLFQSTTSLERNPYKSLSAFG